MSTPTADTIKHTPVTIPATLATTPAKEETTEPDMSKRATKRNSAKEETAEPDMAEQTPKRHLVRWNSKFLFSSLDF